MICFLFGIWCAAAFPNPTIKDYNPTRRVILPVEAFGANYLVQNFRKGIDFPSNIHIAVKRAVDASHKYQDDVRVVITMAPRTYILRNGKPLDFVGARNIDFDGAAIQAQIIPIRKPGQ